MDARENEQRMLDSCIAAALGQVASARDQVEASIFRLAAAAVETYYPTRADALWTSSEVYFDKHADECRLPPADLMAQGHIVTLPRLRSMLLRQLEERDRA
ncbi:MULTISPECIES: hypothetical protein [unclassified Achromobacter]|uniref:hypothetical protein n=1 Tax=unclassified Achromobacter TaxID=2626865 RepID=UPI001E35C1C8|nr:MULTISPECIES: hypothetical protein [unclassified Achromobacter]